MLVPKSLTILIAVCALPFSAHAESQWNQWRGPNRDGISNERGLLKSWPKEGPKLLWQVEGLGTGFSSVAIADDRIFTLGQIDGEEHLISLDLSNGKRRWTLPFGKGDHSNGTPTVDGDRVYAVGLRGDLICANAKTGAKIWSKNFEQDLDGKMMSGWGFSESPLIDGDHLICTPGGSDSIMAALNKRTGETVWMASFPILGDRGTDGAGYSSIVVSNAAGTKQYLQLTGRGIVSVRADDGKFLWGYNRIANDVANIPTPIVDGDLVFCSTGYGTGAALLKITKEDDQFRAEEIYFLNAKQFQNHHGGMIRVADHIFAGHGHNKGFPICLEISTGKTKWGRSIRGEGKGSAAICYADGNLIFRYQDGTVALIEATTKRYQLNGSFKPAFQEGNSWAHPVVFDGKLYLREQNVLMCYDISAPRK